MSTNINAFVEYRHKGNMFFEWCDSFEIDTDYELFKTLGWLEDDTSLHSFKHKPEPYDKSARLQTFLLSPMFDSPENFGSYLTVNEISHIFDHADDSIKNKLCCIVNYMRCLAIKYDVRFIYWFD